MSGPNALNGGREPLFLETTPSGGKSIVNAAGEVCGLAISISSDGKVRATAGGVVFATLDRLGQSYVEAIAAANPNDGVMRVRSLYQDADFPIMFEAAFPIADGKWIVHQLGREGLDGFIRHYGSYIASRALVEGVYLSNGTSTDLSIVNVAAPSGGGWQNTSAENPYAGTVGDTFTFNFTGTGFDLRTYVDNRGGAWRATVDGVDRGLISVWNAAATWDTRTGPRGLPYGPHTVIMTFVGADGVNAPTGGVARGWIARGLTGNGADLRNRGTIRVAQVMDVFTKVQQLASASSNIEAVVESKKVGAAYATTKWPWHAEGTGATAITGQALYVDGVPFALSGDLNNLWSDARRIDVVQAFTGQNVNETAAKLLSGTMMSALSADGYEYALTLDVLQDITVASAYATMCASDNCDRVTLNSGQVQDTSNHTALTMYGPYAKIADSGIMHDPAHSYAWAYEMRNWQQAARVGRPGSVGAFVYVQARTTNRMSKTYNYIAPVGASTWTAGERIQISGRFRGGVKPAI